MVVEEDVGGDGAREQGKVEEEDGCRKEETQEDGGEEERDDELLLVGRKEGNGENGERDKMEGGLGQEETGGGERDRMGTS